jgi:hypothetical protein
MISPFTRFVVIGCIMAAGLSCSSSTEPGSNVTYGLRLWQERHPQNYEFEQAGASSWFPKSGYGLVKVSGGQVVAAMDSAGKPIHFTWTIDSLWNRIVDAKKQGILYTLEIDRQGVPLEADFDFCRCGDANLHIWVRNFVVR